MKGITIYCVSKGDGSPRKIWEADCEVEDLAETIAAGIRWLLVENEMPECIEIIDL